MGAQAWWPYVWGALGGIGVLLAYYGLRRVTDKASSSTFGIVALISFLSRTSASRSTFGSVARYASTAGESLFEVLGMKLTASASES